MGPKKENPGAGDTGADGDDVRRNDSSLTATDDIVNLSRSERRRIVQEVAAITKRDGDRCSICGAAFKTFDSSYGGVTRDGATAVVGGCCAPKLKHVVLAGVYLDRRWCAARGVR